MRRVTFRHPPQQPFPRGTAAVRDIYCTPPPAYHPAALTHRQTAGGDHHYRNNIKRYVRPGAFRRQSSSRPRIFLGWWGGSVLRSSAPIDSRRSRRVICNCRCTAHAPRPRMAQITISGVWAKSVHPRSPAPRSWDLPMDSWGVTAADMRPPRHAQHRLA